MTISQRAEQAGAGETRGLLEELFDVVHPVSMCWDFDQGETHSLRRLPFDALLAINTDEAFLAAAMMLMPEGWMIISLSELGGAGGDSCTLSNPGNGLRADSDAGARTLALALIASIAHTKETDT